MNLKKINKLIIDNIMKENNIKIGKLNNQVGITIDGCCLFLIWNQDFVYDFDKISKGNEINVKSWLNDDHYEDALLTSDIRVIHEKHKTECIKIANSKIHTYVNRKYIDFFDKNCTFKILQQFTPVYVYENEVMVGLIGVIKVKDGESE